MINRARRAAREKNRKPPHIAFAYAQLTEPLPITDGSVDCILSNCVVNLLPPQGKISLFGEVWRVLKPGGRVVLDDVCISAQIHLLCELTLFPPKIIAKRPLEAGIKDDLATYVNCIAGAILLEEYQTLLKDAGFTGNELSPMSLKNF